MISGWITDNYIEIFGAVTGILYVFLEIRQTIWLWPVGIITSAVYIWVFFTGKLYADMSLQVYYLVISIFGWYWWAQGAGHRAQGAGHRAQGSGITGRSLGEGRAQGTPKNKNVEEEEDEKNENGKVGEGEKGELQVTRLKLRTAIILAAMFILLFAMMWLVLTRLTDSPVPVRDAFITSLSIIATWMLARKIYEHWFLWIVVNTTAAFLFLTRGLYPTVILYIVYGVMSFAGLREWKKTIRTARPHPDNK